MTVWNDSAAFAGAGSLTAAATGASAVVSKLNAYAVLSGSQAQVSKLNAYAVLVSAPWQGVAALAASGTMTAAATNLLAPPSVRFAGVGSLGAVATGVTAWPDSALLAGVGNLSAAMSFISGSPSAKFAGVGVLTAVATGGAAQSSTGGAALLIGL